MNVKMENSSERTTVSSSTSGRLPPALFIAGIVIVVGALGAASYFYYQARELKNNPQRAATREIDELVKRVGELMVLPEGETPTIATVTDPERLRGQAFFENAKTGDKVLIYAGARKAILYDPVAHKIVEVAPLGVGGEPQTP